MGRRKDTKERRSKVTKEPKNGVTKIKRVMKNIIGGAFKPSKLNKPKRLNAISFKMVTRIWLLSSFWLPFWLPAKLLLFKCLGYKVTKVTKIYSKTNLGNLYNRTLKTVATARTYIALYIVSSVFWLLWLPFEVVC